MFNAIKQFEVEEVSVYGGRYKITVKFQGKIVDMFKKDTMFEARQAFHKAVYESIAWAEGSRIILQDE